jgi:Fe-S-cluster containining protein
MEIVIEGPKIERGSKKSQKQRAAEPRRKGEILMSEDDTVDNHENRENQYSGELLQNLIGLVEDSNRVARDSIEHDMKSTPPTLAIACKNGCAWCCYLKVTVAAPEVFRIIEHLRTNLPEDQFDSLINSVVDSDSATRGLSDDARFALSLPCPLLFNDRCSVYEVRPMTCRGMNSIDATKCEEGWRNPRSLPILPQDLVLRRNYSLALEGLCGALDVAAVDGNLLELTAALRIALETPDVISRWMAGEPVFAEARA